MSTNLSKLRRDELLGKIEQIRAFLNQSLYDENARRLAGYLNELAAEVKGKKYGLVFEEHREKIDDTLAASVPVLTEEADLFVDGGGEVHFLLEGDNLASLRLLEKTHKGKVDVIYIDPPYNTGSKDFTYDDNYVDETDGFRHSKWISFMEARLTKCRDLLSDSGLIMISINDIELFALKLLCDKIFDEKNYLANLIWQSTPGSNTGLDVKTVTEYILCYAKNKELCTTASRPVTSDEKYNLEDEYVERRGKYCLNKLDRRMTGQHYSDALNYQIKMPDGQLLYPGSSSEKQENWNWRWSKTKVQWGIENGFIVFKKTKDTWSVYFKQYFLVDNNDEPLQRSLPYQNLIKDIDGANSARGTQEVMELFSEKAFDYPKPLNLISYVLNIHANKSATILDFFAGSGTTGHAVLRLNAEDGGHRRFILCTNNENGICRDITYERLRTVITGKRRDGSAYSDGLPGSLKYFRVDFVPVGEKEYYEYADRLLLHVRELVELENAVNFSGNARLAIVLTEEEAAQFFEKQASAGTSTVETLYLGHDVLLSKAQKAALKRHGIGVKVIPQYYYPELNG
ncbi:MAG: site-specific DNA-methyltransferase [Treponema sp.]|nr:site-specific DNA-methyltransferase [Treponema sp.]